MVMSPEKEAPCAPKSPTRVKSPVIPLDIVPPTPVMFNPNLVACSCVAVVEGVVVGPLVKVSRSVKASIVK